MCNAFDSRWSKSKLVDRFTGMSVVVAGSLNIDLVVNLDRMPNPGETVHGRTFQTFPGGKGLNQAVGAARSAAATSMIGALGNDPYSATLLDVMKVESINATFVREIDGPCGTAIIEVDSSGQNRIVVIPGANAEMKASEVDFKALGSAAVMLAQLESPISELTQLFKSAKSAGFTTILNPAPAVQLPSEFLHVTDILIPNQHEAKLLTGIDAEDKEGAIKAAKSLLDQGVKAVVVTLGEIGAVYISETEEIFQAAFPVTPVDTTAAGDVFCGAFAAEIDRGHSIADALRYACAAGGLATTKSGAVPSVPTELEIRSYLKNFN
jgi:ribokinase